MAKESYMLVAAVMLVVSTFIMFVGGAYFAMSIVFLSFNPVEWSAIGRLFYIFISWVVACEQIKTFKHIKSEWDKLTKEAD